LTVRFEQVKETTINYGRHKTSGGWTGNIVLRHPWLALTAIFLLSFFIRFIRLDFHSLWYDEVTTATLVQHKTVTEALKATMATTGSESLHPLYYIILSAWTRLAGSTEAALRTPSVIFGSLSVVVLSLLLYQAGGRRVFGPSLLAVVCPFLMWYSRDARPYALIILLSELHILFYLKLLEKPKSKRLLTAFILSGILLIYSGILTAMLVITELIFSLFARAPRKHCAAAALVLVFSLPLVWQGWRTHFQPASARYRKVSADISLLKSAGIGYEFIMGRSLGPTPDEVRRYTMPQLFSKKPTEIIIIAAALLCIASAFLLSIRPVRQNVLAGGINIRACRALGFIVAGSLIMMVLLILCTGYGINARHLAFIFGPVFVLAVLPAAYNGSKTVKLAFFLPLTVLWLWSCSNQLFAESYQTEDFRSAAKIIESDSRKGVKIIALCHPRALQYYGLDKRLVYLPEGTELTYSSLAGNPAEQDLPVWIVLARPWKYPTFNDETLAEQSIILRREKLTGIDMWLIQLPEGEKTHLGINPGVTD